MSYLETILMACLDLKSVIQRNQTKWKYTLTMYSFLSMSGTYMVWPAWEISSYLFPVNTSIPTNRILACPCFPGFDVAMDTILHGLPWRRVKPFTLRDEAFTGLVRELSASAISRSSSNSSPRPVTPPWKQEEFKSLVYNTIDRKGIHEYMQ